MFKKLWRGIKSLFKSKPNKPVDPPIEIPVPVAPVVVPGEHGITFTAAELFEILQYEGFNLGHKVNQDVGKGCGKYCTSLNEMFKQYNINTYPRICHAISQIGHESGHLRYARELGSDWYFRKRGLDPKWRGRGLIQLTHAYNYRAFQEHVRAWDSVDIMGNPEIVCKLPLAVQAAGFFWEKNNLNELADKADYGLKKLTKKINGGYTGIGDRTRLYYKAKEVLKRLEK